MSIRLSRSRDVQLVADKQRYSVFPREFFMHGIYQVKWNGDITTLKVYPPPNGPLVLASHSTYYDMDIPTLRRQLATLDADVIRNARPPISEDIYLMFHHPRNWSVGRQCVYPKLRKRLRQQLQTILTLYAIPCDNLMNIIPYEILCEIIWFWIV